MSEFKLDDGDLMAYLAGEASPEVVQAIESSEATLMEVNALKSLDVSFFKSQFRSNCPDTQQLLEYEVGFLSDELYAEVKHHLSNCPHCQAEVATLAEVELESESVSTLTALKSKLDELIAAGKTILDTVFVPPAPQPAFALRGEQQGVQTYQAEGYQVILSIQPPVASEKNAKVEGQLNNLDDPLTEFQGTISLYKDESLLKEEPIDTFGYFSFGNIGFGAYDLLIELSSSTLTVRDIEIE